MPGSVGYRIRIRVQGQLDASWWSAVFSNLELEVGPDDTSLISGLLMDQAAVHGLLATIRDLGLSLVSIEAAAQQLAIRAVSDEGRNCAVSDSRTL